MIEENVPIFIREVEFLLARVQELTEKTARVSPSKDMELDWNIVQIVNAKLLVDTYEAREVSSVDWTKKFPEWKVENQKGEYSCVAQAIAKGMLPLQYAIAKNEAELRAFSDRFLWMAAKELDGTTKGPITFLEKEPTSIKGALRVLRKYGCALDEHFKADYGLISEDFDSFYPKIEKYQINSYYNLLDQPIYWKYWLVQKGPFVATIEMDHQFLEGLKGREKMTICNCGNSLYGELDEADKTLIGNKHAVCIVGYHTEETENGIQTFFKVRNSWGTKFGKNGYVWFEEDYAKKQIEETYGIIIY